MSLRPPFYGIERIRDNFVCFHFAATAFHTSGTTPADNNMYTKVPLPDEGLFYTQQIDFEPVEVVIEEVSDTESFDDYLWMENEEEFEKSEMQRLEEEALMEECVEAMQDDEDEEEVVLEHLRLCHSEELLLSESTLNPLAIEFIPAN